MRRIAILAAAVAAAAIVVPATGLAQGRQSSGADRPRVTWEVTITNETPPGSQPLSAPLFVIHTADVDVWSVGDIATHVVAAIAEDANNVPAESALDQLPGVGDVFTGEGDAIPPGESRTYVVTTQGDFNRLTVLTMLVNTNDAFTGLDGRYLRGNGGSTRTAAYDGGSEVNNELIEFIPGPCCDNPFVRDPEGALIAHHPGILGVGDLDPDVYGWTDPVATFTIERSA
jgi:hypothetical protein